MNNSMAEIVKQFIQRKGKLETAVKTFLSGGKNR